MSDDQISILSSSLQCNQAEQLVSEYIDGDLLPAFFNKFEEHLSKCESCRSMLEDCREIVRLAKSIKPIPVPQSVSQRLRRVLREQVGHSVVLIGGKTD